MKFQEPGNKEKNIRYFKMEKNHKEEIRIIVASDISLTTLCEEEYGPRPSKFYWELFLT